MKIFSTFTGIGSPEMALKNLNIDFEIVGISEVDKYAILAYDAIHNNGEFVEEVSKEKMLDIIKTCNIAYNFSTGKSEIPKNFNDLKKLYNAHIRSKNYGDIRKIDESYLPNFDLLTYSYPCKNISLGGKQEGLVENSNTQSSLLWECKRIIEKKKPKFLLMENVKNLVGKNHKVEFDKWCSYLETLGYNNYWDVLNAKDYGVAQNRERVIMVSILKEYDNGYILPTSNGITKTMCDILEPIVEESVYFNYDLYKHLKVDIDKNIYNKLIMIGMLGIKGKDAIRRIYSSTGLAPTLDAMQGGNRMPKVFLVNENKVRRVTPLECWRLMGYSDIDFNKAKNVGLSNSKLCERSGRGIVIPMLESVLGELLKNV